LTHSGQSYGSHASHQTGERAIVPSWVRWPPMGAMQPTDRAREWRIDQFVGLGELLVGADAAPRQVNWHFRRGDREALHKLGVPVAKRGH
jgi:hypothetical protein